MSEVRRILVGRGHLVSGPFFKAKWFGGRTQVIHEDIFGVWDLISWYQGEYHLHQVTDLNHKAEHEHKINELGMIGYIWCRTKQANRIKYRVFWGGIEVTEQENP